VAGAGGSGVTCPIKTGGSLCTTIPKYSGTQVVDGSGADFCDVPATIHALKSGVTLDGSKPPPVPEVLSARVAWDSVGIHAHFHVEDMDVENGDAIEFDIGGRYPAAGFFDGVSNDVGSTNLAMGVPWTTTLHKWLVTIPPVAWMRYQGRPTTCVPSPCDAPLRPLVTFMQPLVGPAKWAYRVVPGGYEFEVLMPWSVLGRSTPPTSGTAVGADLGLAANNGVRTWLAVNPLPPGAGTPCDASAIVTEGGSIIRADPSCDDRGWCSPTLE
jgi:hypothetical protein